MVCEEWATKFENFMEWAIENGYREGLTIDRVDNYGHYEPSNCRWSTFSVQSRNRRKLKNNTSGVNGVYFHKNMKVWIARIKINTKLKFIKSGKDFFEIVCSRKSADNKYGFHENHGRTPINDLSEVSR